jgi:hypothetical protein
MMTFAGRLVWSVGLMLVVVPVVGRAKHTEPPITLLLVPVGAGVALLGWAMDRRARSGGDADLPGF